MLTVYIKRENRAVNTVLKKHESAAAWQRFATAAIFFCMKVIVSVKKTSVKKIKPDWYLSA